MRYVTIREYEDEDDGHAAVVGAMNGMGHTVLNYVHGFYVYGPEEIAIVGTTPAGSLVLLMTNGTMVMHNTGADLLSQHVPFARYIEGPSDGNEMLAAWNEWLQRQTQVEVES